MKRNVLLSVVIPIYGVEAFIEKCLHSICSGSYKNLEIICVNDATKDNAMEIVERFAKADNRIKIVNNETNLGLFRARVEGMKVATGDYIAFVDADDYVSCDWFRLLLNRSLETGADMVIGNTVNVDENGRMFYYNNYHSFTRSHKTVEKEDLLDTFYAQEGACFAWHTVWNKLYSARLIKACFPYFEKIDCHLIMGEDIAYSSVLYTHANKLAFADADCYFYYRHSEASTSITLPKAKIIRNIRDLNTVFQFVKSSLKAFDPSLYEKYLPSIEKFRARYQRIWRGNVYVANLIEDEEALQAMRETFGDEKSDFPFPHDFYFYELTSEWDGRLIDLKQTIQSDKIKYVSFDIFDTLLTRPLCDPSEIFYFVGKEVTKLFPFMTEETFLRMRKLADSAARQALSLLHPEYEDVTLTEIYAEFAKIAGISVKQAAQIQKIEEQTEIRFCKARKTAKELFEFAICVGKTVVLTSDMYLESSTVKEILKKNGYDGYAHLFLSSDTRSLKTTGNLFRYAANKLGCQTHEILHIGDNWNVDKIKAEECGLISRFFPKALETYENGISDIYTGDLAAPFSKKEKTAIDATRAFGQLPIRCAVSLIANKMYDNPFKHIQWDSLYNGDPYYMGYVTLGMHVFGIADWIYREALKNHYSKIVFLARDGKMVKEAFDMICAAKGTPIQSDYFYATRKALMLYSIKDPKDFYNLYTFVDIQKHTPLQIFEMFSAILSPLTEEAKQKYAKRGIDLEAYLTGDKEFFNFVSALIEISYDAELHKSVWATASAAFKNIFDAHTATFDLGYSGRLQSIICDLADCPVDTFFVHTNGYNTELVRKESYKIHSYFDYTPTITGIIREYMMSDPTPSCIAYAFEDGKVIPVIENDEESFTYDRVYAIKEMQKGAIHFVSDYVEAFGALDTPFAARNSDYAAAFDHMLLNSTQFDRYTFSNSVIEDEVYSGYRGTSLFDTWTWHLSTLHAPVTREIIQNGELDLGDSKWKKAIFYLMYDRKTLKEKVSARLQNHKIVLGILKLFYKACRGVYRLFRKKK